MFTGDQYGKLLLLFFLTYNYITTTITAVLFDQLIF